MNTQAIRLLNALQGLKVLGVNKLSWLPSNHDEKTGINYLLNEGLVMLEDGTSNVILSAKGADTQVPFLLELP